MFSSLRTIFTSVCGTHRDLCLSYVLEFSNHRCNYVYDIRNTRLIYTRTRGIASEIIQRLRKISYNDTPIVIADLIYFPLDS